jgi:oxygen-dependent protoporphyrinogen oxidase
MSIDTIAVIGAGIAGLTAAYELSQAGYDVLVLEKRDHVGGRMWTVDWEGFRLDIGAKFVTTSDKSLLSVVDEVGLADQLVEDESGLDITIYRDGRTHSANFLSIPSYFGWSGVSLKARLAMLKLIPHFLRLGRLDNPYHLEQAPGPDLAEDYEEFFREHISAEMFEYWAIPMFETMCAYTGEDVSRKAFLAMLAGYFNANSVYFRQGVGVLPEALAEHVTVELEATVRAIHLLPDNSGARITYTHRGEEETVTVSRVVVAVPGNHVLPLFPTPRPAWRAFFPTVHYSTGAMHYQLVESDFEPPHVRTLVPRGEGLPINAITFEERDNGRWLMLTDPSVYTFDMNDDADALAQEAQAAVKKVYPSYRGRLINHRIFKWRDKLPAFRPGYLDALARFWAEPQEGPVYFCGDYFAGPSTGGALYTGRETVTRLLRDV